MANFVIWSVCNSTSCFIPVTFKGTKQNAQKQSLWVSCKENRKKLHESMTDFE